MQESFAEKLQQELTTRGQYYFKGFGMLLQELFSNIEIFAVAEATPERKKLIRFRLKTITDLYAKIPFDQIAAHPDFNLLATIRDAISRLHPAVDEIINGKKDIKEVEAIITVILNNGQAYQARLTDILHELRKQPGHENDGLRSTCVITGKVWNSAI